MAHATTLLDRLIETLAQLRFTEDHLGGIEVDWAGSDTQETWRDEARRELARDGVMVALAPDGVAVPGTINLIGYHLTTGPLRGDLAWIEREGSREKRTLLYRAVATYDPLDPPTPEAVGLGGLIHTMEQVVCRQCWQDAERRAELTPTGFWAIWWCPRCKIKL